MGTSRDTCRILVRKSEGKRSLGRPRCRWEDNLKIDITEEGWGRGHGLDRLGSGQEKIARSYACSNERLGSIPCCEFLE
jgi:hypothetical protein